jgi:hypothetical protein
MIYKVEGDVLMSRADAIAQRVSVNDPVNSGLASKLQGKFPSMATNSLNGARIRT